MPSILQLSISTSALLTSIVVLPLTLVVHVLNITHITTIQSPARDHLHTYGPETPQHHLRRTHEGKVIHLE